MKAAALVDTNILIDITSMDPDFGELSLSLLRQLRALDWGLIVNPVILAETVTEFGDSADQYDFVDAVGLKVEPLPADAGYPAGQAFQIYRQRGGRRSQTLPDFLIGAHALVGDLGICTRDPRGFRSYFPTVDLITPETHLP